MRRILSVIILLAVFLSLNSDAYAWKKKLLKKMTKPTAAQKCKGCC